MNATRRKLGFGLAMLLVASMCLAGSISQSTTTPVSADGLKASAIQDGPDTPPGVVITVVETSPVEIVEEGNRITITNTASASEVIEICEAPVPQSVFRGMVPQEPGTVTPIYYGDACYSDAVDCANKMKDVCASRGGVKTQQYDRLAPTPCSAVCNNGDTVSCRMDAGNA